MMAQMMWHTSLAQACDQVFTRLIVTTAQGSHNLAISVWGYSLQKCMYVAHKVTLHDVRIHATEFCNRYYIK